jgi:hypothetical protein
MKTNNNPDDLKGLCFSIILLICAALSGGGVYDWFHPQNEAWWDRLVTIPGVITLWLVRPETSSEMLLGFTFFAGSFFFYFVVGMAILLIIQRKIKRHQEKQNRRGDGGGNNRI